MRNNLTAVLIMIWIGLILVSNIVIFNNFYGVNTYTTQTTGKVFTIGELSFCIGGVEDRTFITPAYYEAVSGITNIELSFPNAEPNSIQNVSFYLLTDITNLSNVVFLGNDNNNSDTIFSIPWNTTTESDIGCSRAVLANISGSCVDYQKISYTFSINNQDEEPTWNYWKNNVTTNFTNYLNWTDLNEVIIGNEYGIINFTRINIDGANLDTNVNISDNFVNVNQTAMPCFDQAARITLYDIYPNLNESEIKIFLGESYCVNCPIVSFANGTVVFDVEDFYNSNVPSQSYYTVRPWTFDLALTSTTDNNIKYAKENVTIYAQYSNTETQEIFTNTSCTIGFYNQTTQTYMPRYYMTYNSNLQKSTYERSFDLPGYKDYSVYCWDPADGTYPWLQEFSSIFITNKPPVKSANLPTEVIWVSGATASPFNLNDYFSDFENESLTFSANYIDNVQIFISSSGYASFIAIAGWTGETQATFYATDPHGDSAASNTINLKVIDKPADPEDQTSSPAPRPLSEFPCVESWSCGSWGNCLYTGIQYRNCYDENQCDTETYKPSESVTCSYVSTCDDSIKNCHLIDFEYVCETGVDCGGPCDDCPTCDDKIQNQGEEGVDCGGPCTPCSEEEIPRTPEEEEPTFIPKKPPIDYTKIILWVLLTISLTGFITKYGYPAVLDAAEKAKHRKRVEKEIKENIYIITIHKLSMLEESFSRRTLENIILDFDQTMRHFFNMAFNLDYSFSIDTIKEAVKRKKLKKDIKASLTRFSSKFTKLSYGDTEFSNTKIKVLIGEALNIVRALSKIEFEGKTGEEIVLGFNGTLKDLRTSLKKGDLRSARSHYMKLNEIYELLPPEKKHIAYLKISAAYEVLKRKAEDQWKTI